ncbi:hypothetical protein Lal_00032615 [Lupinus albus]|nr:hypothetical protein Lal_00032615 [Lupinus albus]
MVKRSSYNYWDNGHKSSKISEIWEVFHKWGKVVDVVIPARLDKYVKRFGFVRFQGVSNSKLMVVKLDRIWIDSYKI